MYPKIGERDMYLENDSLSCGSNLLNSTMGD